ncbi:MAG: TRAP transporter small permease subunit [bacterium]|nr:TRAP transporter small permease subunit [bacterium]
MRDALRLFADGVSGLSNRLGMAAAWLYPVLVAVMIINVALRYGFGRGFIELEELQWHLYAAAFLLGFAYTYVADEHVRADLLAARLTPRARAWIEMLGCLLLLFPFASIVTFYAFDFFLQSFLLGESSEMPSGLPYRWIIKAVLLIALAMLSLQSLGTAASQALVLWPGRREES